MREIGNADTLRFSTAGSVDDGKSTLIGRLLFDAHGILDDQLASLAGATVKHGHAPPGEEIDFSLLTDGLIAEREQGITIDVAYRYFTTPKRRFIIADTPGHEQYTRNMITGASTADLTVVLVDAARGLTTQSRRHAVIASLLRIPHLVVAINKMDLVKYDQSVFDRLRGEFAPFLDALDFAQITFIPISALKGEMLAKRGNAMPWFGGATLLETLESTTAHKTTGQFFRFPVQRLMKAKFGTNVDMRGYQGTIAGGHVRIGDQVVALPCGLDAAVVAIHSFDKLLDQAGEGTAVTLVLDRQIDISRGDMLVFGGDAEMTSQTTSKIARPSVGTAFSAKLCWLDPVSLDRSRRYWLKHTSNTTRAVVEKISFRLNVETLTRELGATALFVNEIAEVRISTQQPIIFDAFDVNRNTGCFVLIDDATNRTVAAGMIIHACDLESAQT